MAHKYTIMAARYGRELTEICAVDNGPWAIADQIAGKKERSQGTDHRGNTISVWAYQYALVKVRDNESGTFIDRPG